MLDNKQNYLIFLGRGPRKEETSKNTLRIEKFQIVLFLSLYPESADSFELLKDSLDKLKLNDAALDFTLESKMALGRGI